MKVSKFGAISVKSWTLVNSAQNTGNRMTAKQQGKARRGHEPAETAVGRFHGP